MKAAGVLMLGVIIFVMMAIMAHADRIPVSQGLQNPNPGPTTNVFVGTPDEVDEASPQFFFK